MKKKLELKPAHLVITGITIIMLGILIPSLFINALGTIGLSIIIGLLVLVSAYILFSVNTVKSKGVHTLKWLLLPLVIASLITGGLFINHRYQQNLKNKIYAVGETVRMPGFDFTVTKVDLKPVDLPVDDTSIQKFGDLSVTEDCNSLSTAKTWRWTGRGIGIGWDGWEKVGPSDQEVCSRRNSSRVAINDYIRTNKLLSIDYKIAAKDTVRTSNIVFTMMPDSGRSVNHKIKGLTGNQFLRGGITEKSEKSRNEVSHLTYSTKRRPSYKPYEKSDLGGDINKGLERTGHIRVDMQNSEGSIDLKIKYRGDTRIVRITR